MIIGITGTNGAGKGTVVDYLVKQKGFTHFSVRKYIEEEITRRGLPINRDNTNFVGNDMRQKHGFYYWDELIAGDMAKTKGPMVFESIRVLAAAKKFKEQGGILWGVDADRKTRYERSVMRGTQLDKISFEKFCEQEDREMHQTAEYDMNVFGVMQIADKVFLNNGTEEELFAQVEAALRAVDNGLGTRG